MRKMQIKKLLHLNNLFQYFLKTFAMSNKIALEY